MNGIIRESRAVLVVTTWEDHVIHTDTQHHLELETQPRFGLASLSLSMLSVTMRLVMLIIVALLTCHHQKCGASCFLQNDVVHFSNIKRLLYIVRGSLPPEVDREKSSVQRENHCQFG
jgi:hypothetical protein